MQYEVRNQFITNHPKHFTEKLQNNPKQLQNFNQIKIKISQYDIYIYFLLFDCMFFSSPFITANDRIM